MQFCNMDRLQKILNDTFNYSYRKGLEKNFHTFSGDIGRGFNRKVAGNNPTLVIHLKTKDIFTLPTDCRSHFSR